MEKLFQLGPVDGPTQLFKMNYIENVDPENRSLWCIDPSREKCLIREDGNWIVDLKGKKILVTAGATSEEIDPVRVITNKSSGKMGVYIAEQAFLRGADVTLIRGTNSIEQHGEFL